MNTTLQAGITARFYLEYGVVLGCFAVIVALLTGFGVEAKGVRLAADSTRAGAQPS